MARISASLNVAEPTGSLHVVTLNPEYIMRSRREAALRQIIAIADVRVADGAGVVAAARLLDRPAHGIARVTGNDLIAALASESVPLFLLGAASGVAEEAAAALRRQYPAVRIAGTWAGDAGPGDDAEVRQRINATDAQVVLVAYGMPKQDYWIARNSAASRTCESRLASGERSITSRDGCRAPRHGCGRAGWNGCTASCGNRGGGGASSSSGSSPRSS